MPGNWSRPWPLYGALERCAIVSFEMDLVRAVNQSTRTYRPAIITLWNPAAADAERRCWARFGRCSI